MNIEVYTQELDSWGGLECARPHNDCDTAHAVECICMDCQLKFSCMTRGFWCMNPLYACELALCDHSLLQL